MRKKQTYRVFTLILLMVLPVCTTLVLAQETAPIKPEFEEFYPSTPAPKPQETPQPPAKKTSPIPAPPSSPAPTTQQKKTTPAKPPKPKPQAPPLPPGPPPAPHAAPPIEALPLVPSTVPPKFMEVMAAQILLDRQLISPGCIDGVIGRQTRQALATFQLEKGLPVTGLLDEKTKKALGSRDDLSTEHVITHEEIALLSPLPESWRGKSQAQSLQYETALELVAEKYHASQNGIRKLNPQIDWDFVEAGTVVSVPKINQARLPKASFIQISLSQKLIRVFDKNQRLIAQFPCSIAQKEEKRPVGALQVINYAPNPTYLFSPDLFKEDARKEGIKGKIVIPPGPNNPVGVAWIGLNRPGYGIHGTPRPEDIGLTESRGCFRLTNWNAQRLMSSISIGIPVYVEMDFQR